jgi:hypothetical protein
VFELCPVTFPAYAGTTGVGASRSTAPRRPMTDAMAAPPHLPDRSRKRSAAVFSVRPEAPRDARRGVAVVTYEQRLATPRLGRPQARLNGVLKRRVSPVGLLAGEGLIGLTRVVGLR